MNFSQTLEKLMGELIRDSKGPPITAGHTLRDLAHLIPARKSALSDIKLFCIYAFMSLSYITLVFWTILQS